MDSIVASRVPRRLCLCQYVTLPFPRGFISRAAVSKSLSIFNILVDCLDLRFLPLADQYINLFLDNANTGYAEVICSCGLIHGHHSLDKLLCRSVHRSHRISTLSSLSNGVQYTPQLSSSCLLVQQAPILSEFGLSSSLDANRVLR